MGGLDSGIGTDAQQASLPLKGVPNIETLAEIEMPAPIAVSKLQSLL